MRLVTPLAIPGSASPHCGGGSFYLLHSGSQLQHVPPICRVKWSGCCHGNTSTSLDRVGRGLAKIERTCLGSDSLATRGLEFSPCILCACVLLSPLPPHTPGPCPFSFLRPHLLPGDTVIYSSYANTALTVPIFALSGFPSLSFPNKETNIYTSKCPHNEFTFSKYLVTTYGGSHLPSTISTC